MSANNRSFVSFPRLAHATLLLVTAACHKDVAVEESASATQAEGLFTSGADGDSSEPIPTTSGGDEPEDDSVDPLKYCELRPDASYGGVAFSCAGEASGELSFDYYGDPDLPLNTMLACIDISEWSKKDPGYVYTCFAVVYDKPFGPDSKLPNGRQIEACCLEGSPENVVASFCTIDAAEETCRSVSDGLDALRMELPKIPKLHEINEQLLRLNKFLAESESQTDCSSTVAKDLLAGGIDKQGNVANWQPQSKVQEDPDAGWSWFRNINLRVEEYAFTELVETGEVCDGSDPTSLLDGALDGRLDIVGTETDASSHVLAGAFALSTSECAGASCSARLDSLRVTAPSIDLGTYRFTDVEARLVTPVVGERAGDALAFVGNRMVFEIQGRLASTDEHLADQDRMTIRVRATDTVRATVSPDGSFTLDNLRVGIWPFETKLTARSAGRK